MKTIQQDAHGPYYLPEKHFLAMKMIEQSYVYTSSKLVKNCYYLPFKRKWFCVSIKQNFLHPRMLCAKFGWNCPSGSGEEDFCLLFHYSLPLEKSLTFYLKKLEFPSPNDTVCKVWVKLAQWFMRKAESVKSLETDLQKQGIRKAHLFRWAKYAVKGI